MSQSSYFKSRLNLVTWGVGVGKGKPKTWKTLRVEGSGGNLVVNICKSPRYMIDITGTDPLSLG